MFKFLLIAATIALVGCSTQTIEISNSYELPEGLKDCKVYSMRSKVEQTITVLRCPSSQTTVHYRKAQGKSYRDYNISTVEN